MFNLQRVLDAGSTDRVFTAAAARIGGAHDELWSHLMGSHSPLSPRSVTADSKFDLGSLTKILSTTLICAHALEEGLVKLNDRPWPQWPHVTLQDVLLHQSGLPAFIPYYLALPRQGDKQAHMRHLVLTTTLTSNDRTTVYSDVGFLALGFLLEDRLGAPLDQLFYALAQKHYGPNSFLFANRLGKSLIVPNDIQCPKHVGTRVHDPNAWAMGGVAGHAGLFGSLNDLTLAAKFYLNAFVAPASDSFSRTIKKMMLARGPRALGFDTASKHGSTDGALSVYTVGHLAFAGPSLWIDPLAKAGEGAYFILLCNSVFPASSPMRLRLKLLRQQFHRAGARLVNH